MALACSDKDVTIAGDDTDVMIILLHCIYKKRGDYSYDYCYQDKSLRRKKVRAECKIRKNIILLAVSK